MTTYQALPPLALILGTLSLSMPTNTSVFALCCCTVVVMSLTRLSRAVDMKQFRIARFHGAVIALFTVGLFIGTKT